MEELNKKNIGKNVVVSNVNKLFSNVKVLEDVSLQIEAGQFITILGASGCGKTTLLKIIAGFEKPSSGKIFVDGEDITNKKAYLRNIGILFQNYALFPHMTVRQNIAYPLHIRKFSSEEISKSVKKVVEMVELQGLEERYPSQLSGGQQQRVALARAVVYNPTVLLLDEPFSALDLKLRHSMQMEIKRLHRKLGITTISVTHDQEEAMTMSDKICIIKNGVIQQFDTPEKIYTAPANSFVADFMGSINLFDCKIIDKQYAAGNYTYKLMSMNCKKTYVISSDCDYPYKENSNNFCKLAIRPEQLFLVNNENAENVFMSKVQSVIYLGDRLRINLIVDNTLPLTMKTAYQQDINMVAGDTINVGFNQKGPSLIFD